MKNEKIKTTGRKFGISATVATVVVVVVVLAQKCTKDFETIVTAETQQRLLTIARLQADNIKNHIIEHQSDLQLLAGNLRIKNAIIDNESAQDILKSDGYSIEQALYDERSQHFNGLYRLDAKGMIQSRIPFKQDRIGADFSQKPGVKAVIETHKPYISEIFLSFSGDQCISICYPVFKDKQFIGIERAMVYLKTLSKIAAEIDVGNKGYAQIFDDDGTIVTHPQADQIGKDIIAMRKKAYPDYDWSEMEAIVARMTRGEEGVGHYHSVWWDADKPKFVKKLTAFAPIKLKNESWSLGVTMDYDEVSGPVKAYARNIHTAAGLLILVLGGAGLWFYRVQKEKTKLAAKAESAEELLATNQQLNSEIIERKQAEEDRKKSELKFRTLYEFSDDAFMLLDEKGFFDCNKATVKLFACKDKEEFCSKHPADLSPLAQPCGTDSMTLANQRIATAMKEGSNRFEWVHKRINGHDFPAEVLLNAMELDGKKVLQAVVRDITEREQAEEEMRNLSKFPSENPNPVLRIAKDGEVLYSNKAGELLLSKWKSGIGKTVPEKWCNLITKAFAFGKVQEEEEEEEVKGKIFSIIIAPVKEAGYINLYANDMTKRKQAEQKLRYSNNFSQTILNSMHEVLAVINIDDYTIEKANKAFLEMYQLNEEDLKGKTCYQITHNRSTPCNSAQDPCPLIETLKTGSYANSEHTHYSSNGKKVFAEVATSPIMDETGKITKVLHITRDITERKQIEEERWQMQSRLRQTQKMEAIGTLAGGIAHDFNNILGALIGYADLAKDDIPEGTVAHQNQQEVLIAANRAKELVKQILTFSRKDKAELKPVCINAIVQEVLKLLRSSLPTSIEIKQDINYSSSIMADETHIHQVLLNLATNASHAMEENGGVLEVSLTDVNIESDILIHDRNMQRGSYVKLIVKDSGCGMSKEVQERIFEPFFTTKEVGKGTGMGLSVVHGILKKHNGSITVDSKAGEGTTFEIFFPCVRDVAMKEAEGSEPTCGQGEQILLVDDEPSIIDMATQMLTRIGYKVIGKTNSIEALEVFQEDPDKFDLVITDQTMPKMKGTELAEKLMSIRPDIPIVLCSGHSESIDSKSVKSIGIKELVMKPFNREEMSQIIREILDKKGVTV